MLLTKIELEENFIKKIFSKFKKQKPDQHTKFNKIKQINWLKKELYNFIKEYLKNIKTNPKNKNEYYQELGENLLNSIAIVLSDLRNEIGDFIEENRIDEEQDKSIIRSLNKLISELNYIDEDTSLINVEKILVHIFEKIKEHMNINYEMDIDPEGFDPDYEALAIKDYLTAFFYYPTANFEKLHDIVKQFKSEQNNTSGHSQDDINKLKQIMYNQSEYYKKVKENNKDMFIKEWDKNQDRWIKDEFANDISEDFYQSGGSYENYEDFIKTWIEKNVTPEVKYRVFLLHYKAWFDQMLKIKFHNLWQNNFKQKWMQVYKQDIENEKSKLAHLKEKLKVLFEGKNI